MGIQSQGKWGRRCVLGKVLNWEVGVSRKLNLHSLCWAWAPCTRAGPRNPFDNERFELRLSWLTLRALESDLAPEISGTGSQVEKSH